MICPMCCKLFKNPKYLPCYHSYCRECLEELQTQNSKIICLRCKKDTIVLDGGVKDLPNNYFMENLVNKLILNYKLENKTELRCEECKKDDPVVVFCRFCNLFLCYYCKESQSHHSHTLISLMESEANKDLIQSMCKFPSCQEHDLELDYFCETCEKLVCEQCIRGHKKCMYALIKKVANKYHNELQEISASLETMTENISMVQESIEDVRTEIRQQGDKISEEIDLYYEEVIEKLLQQKEQVKQQVCNTVSQKEKAIKGQWEELMHLQKSILNVKTLRNAIQESSDQEVLSVSNELLSSFESLTEEHNKIGCEPIESANTKVTHGNEPLPQVVKHFTTIDSLSFEVKDFNSSVQPGQNVMLEVITKDSRGDYYPRGGCDFTVFVEARPGEKKTAQVTDKNDGTYIIDYTAQKVGEINLSVFANGQEIKKSPFKITVQENPIKYKIIPNDEGKFDQLRGIACSNNGMWAVADWIKNCVYLFDNQDNLIKSLGSQGSGNGQFVYPCGVAFDSNNELYVTDCNNHRVQKFDINCDYLLQFGGKGDAEGQLNHPIGIKTHQDKVYVADRDNGRISVFQNDGKFCVFIGQKQLSQFFDITVKLNGEILAADWGHNCIHIFATDGHFINNLTLHKGTKSLKFKGHCSLTTDLNEYILIADTNNHCISIFDNIGNCLNCFEPDDPFKFPSGIDIDSNSNIYVTDTGNKRIQIVPAYRALYFD